MQRREFLTIGVATALLAGSASTSYGVNVWLSFEGDPATGPATDKLSADGAQNATIYPDAAVSAQSLIFGASLLQVQDATQTFNGLEIQGVSGNLGTQVTISVYVRNVPAGRRKLFSNYNGSYANTGIEWVFDSDGQLPEGGAMWFLVVDPGSDQWYEFDIPTGAFNISQDGNIHHFAATFDHGVVKVYFDGTELSGTWYGGAAPTFDHWDLKGNPLRFGEDNPGTNQSNNPFLGYADDILILSRALSSNEIGILAQEGAAALMDLPGACCLPAGACAETTSLGSCLAQSGAWNGSGSTCATVTCEPMMKACCFNNGTCSDLVMDQCQGQGGAWNASATCADNLCPSAGACCFNDGTCSDLVENACVAQGGNWTAGTSCAQNPCPPGGACCFSNGACATQIETLCQAQYGTWSGAGTTCEATTCVTFAPRIWLDFEGDPATGPVTDKLTDDGAQNAVLYNAPAPPAPVLVTGTDAIFGTSLSNASLMSFPLAGTQDLGEKFTLATHLKRVAAGEVHLFTNHDGGAQDRELLVTIDSDGHVDWTPSEQYGIPTEAAILAEWQDANGYKVAYVPTAAVSAWVNSDTPHHVAWTFERMTVDGTDGMDVKIYFDGVQLGGAFWPGVTSMPGRVGDLLYGEDYPPSVGNSYLLGGSDDILVLRRALSPAQVTTLATGGAASLGLTEEASGEILYTMEGDTIPTLTDKLAQLSAQNATVPIPQPFGSLVDATSPLFGLQSLNATNPRTNVNVFNGAEFPGVRYMGTQATLAVHMRNVPAGRRKLFSSYDGTYMTPLIEWVFDSAGQQADGVAMWIVVSDPATGNPFYEFDVPRGTFNFSQDANVHHIAMTYDRGDLKLYLDGNPLPGGWAPPYGPPPLDMALDFTRSLRFGEDQAPTDMRNTPFRGYADDLLILPQALDDLQIQSIARNGVKAWLEMQGQKYPDFNNDGYVNAADLEFFIGCATGAEIPLANPAGSCAAADLDSDGDVDMDDFGLFQACISGGSKAGVGCTRVP